MGRGRENAGAEDGIAEHLQVGGEDGGVVLADVPAEERPDGRERRGEVDVAAPDPESAFPFLVVDEGDGLGIVDEDDVGLLGQDISVLAVDLAEEVPFVRRELLPDAV